MCSSVPACVLRSPSRGVPTISSGVEILSPDSQDSPRCCTAGMLPAITRTHDVEEGESSQPESYAIRFHQPPNTSAQPVSSRAAKSLGWKTSKFFSRTMSSGEILRGLKKLSLTSTDSAEEQVRPRKSKSGQLKKRSSTGNDDEDRARSPRSPGGFRPLSKAMSLSEPGSTGKTAGLGIVCKKEDLKAILCTATSKKFPLASPKKRRLRQTKSASFEPPSDTTRKDPVRRAGSEETHKRFEYNELKTDVEAKEVQLQIPIVDTSTVTDLNSLNVTSTPDKGDKATAVKWDECEVVDAVIIGDAIESFLKGSMTDSKRVSFKRTHSDRKTKSDG